jgi:hypothetical protein
MKTQRHQSVSSLNWVLRVLKSAFTDHGAFGSEVNLVYAMHFSLLFIEESSIIFETLRALCDISCEAKALWAVDTQSPKGELKVVNVVDSILQRWSTIDEFVAKWAREAQPWAVACCDVKTARRSLVILNALKPTLGTEFFRLLTTAVSYHISQIAHDPSIADEVALFVGYCFSLFEQHLEEPDMASFAFPFACAFLQCPHFQTNCLDRAMPIFLHCVRDPLLASAARRVLVQAFTPYARQLESNEYARALLVNVVKTSEAPALYIVVAAFLVNKVPFPDLARSYDQIVSNEFSTEQLNLAFFLLTNMTKTASSPLAESILRVVTDLIKRNENVVNRDSLTQLYAFAVSRLAISASAVDFIAEVARVDPSVAAPSELVPPVQKSAEDVRKEISQLVKQTKDVVPIARCKELSDLQGMIDQKNPPKIYPFAAQYEMYMGLGKGSKKMQLGVSTRFSSRSSGIIGLAPNRSFFLAAAMQNVGMLEVQYAPLRKKTVCQTFLDIPVVDNSAWKFVISPAEFLKLDDDEQA